MESLPNDMYREIMKLLDYSSICAFYDTCKTFRILPQEEIKKYRILSNVIPNKLRRYDNKLIISKDQMEWLSRNLTQESIMQIILKTTDFKIDDRYSSLLEAKICKGTRKTTTGNFVFLYIIVKYNIPMKIQTTRYRLDSTYHKHHFQIIFPSVELVDILMKQKR